MMMFLRCVGQAVVDLGMRGLMGLVPFAEQVCDVANDAIGRYRQAHREEQLTADLQEVVRADARQVAGEARQIAREVAAGRSNEEIHQVETWLSQIPGVARQSLRRPQDPTGKTVPNTIDLGDPVQFANLLPQRAPYFKSGAAMPNNPRWRFVELLGSGGFGEVWLVQHNFLEQRGAAKFCLDPASRDRLLRHECEVVKRVMTESRAAKSNEHGIVPLIDVCLDGDVPWLLYEYVDGGDLSGMIRHLKQAAPPQRAAQALGVLRNLAGIIGRFHRLPQPIIHRDLKPANILLKRDGSRLLLRVTDFGISHVAAAHGITRATTSAPSLNLGETYRGAHTPLYASPQQKRGLAPDVRDDVHALGVIGYQLLLADLGAERPAGKWRKRLADCRLAARVLDLLESCWDDDPNARPRDALALAEALAAPPVKPSAPASKPSPDPPVRRIGDRMSNDLGMKFAWVPPGKTWLGGGGGKPGTQEFTLAKGLWCGVYPVTQAEWEAVMGNNPSHFSGNPRCPAEQVSWNDAQEFLRVVNGRLAHRELTYRLPSEEEWEYICRGGPLSSVAQSAFHFYFARSKTDLTPEPGNDLSSTQANFDGNHPAGSASKGPSLQRTSEVGSYPPNPLGIFDLHGNVQEWTSSLEGATQVVRGGSWSHSGAHCTAAHRGRRQPGTRGFVGLRLLAVPSE
jgi:formylglycine-generating enzyme required for sulfatase activity